MQEETATNDHVQNDIYPGMARLSGIKRNKLACIVCTLTAVLFVSLTGLLIAGLSQLVSLLIFGKTILVFQIDKIPYLFGPTLSVLASIFNFYIFIVSIPITWFIISMSVGRLVHRKIAKRMAYVKWMSIWGAILVGGTCILAGAVAGADQTSYLNGLIAFFTAVGTGAVIGTMAGYVNGWLFVLILRPETQLRARLTDIAEAF